MTMNTPAMSRWWRIMPIVFITYSLAYLDRANYSCAAAAGINADLGITKGQCPQTDFCLYFSLGNFC